MLPWPVASKTNSILRRSSVTCVELVRQNIAKNFWATKRRALGKPALKIRHAFAHPGLRRNCDRRLVARKFIVSPTSAAVRSSSLLASASLCHPCKWRWPPDRNLCHSLRQALSGAAAILTDSRGSLELVVVSFMALRQMIADPLDSCLRNQEFSKIPTRGADTRTTPYSTCSLLRSPRRTSHGRPRRAEMSSNNGSSA